MKKEHYILLVFLVFATVQLTSSCTKYSSNNSCDPNKSCDTQRWDSGFVTINVTQNITTGVPITIYEGYVEDHSIVLQDTLFDGSWEYYLPINTRYAVEAFYYESGKTIIALDGEKLKQSSFTNCGNTCYNKPTIDLDVKKL